MGPKGQAFKTEGSHRGVFSPFMNRFPTHFPIDQRQQTGPQAKPSLMPAFLNKVLLGTAMPTPLRTVHSCFHTLETESVTHKA